MDRGKREEFEYITTRGVREPCTRNTCTLQVPPYIAGKDSGAINSKSAAWKSAPRMVNFLRVAAGSQGLTMAQSGLKILGGQHVMGEAQEGGMEYNGSGRRVRVR